MGTLAAEGSRFPSPGRTCHLYLLQQARERAELPRIAFQINVVRVEIIHSEKLHIFRKPFRVRAPVNMLARHHRNSRPTPVITASILGRVATSKTPYFSYSGSPRYFRSSELHATSASTSLFVTMTHWRCPSSEALSNAVACSVVPDPAKKSRIKGIWPVARAQQRGNRGPHRPTWRRGKRCVPEKAT